MTIPKSHLSAHTDEDFHVMKPKSIVGGYQLQSFFVFRPLNSFSQHHIQELRFPPWPKSRPLRAFHRRAKFVQ